MINLSACRRQDKYFRNGMYPIPIFRNVLSNSRPVFPFLDRGLQSCLFVGVDRRLGHGDGDPFLGHGEFIHFKTIYVDVL